MISFFFLKKKRHFEGRRIEERCYSLEEWLESDDVHCLWPALFIWISNGGASWPKLYGSNSRCFFFATLLAVFFYFFTPPPPPSSSSTSSSLAYFCG